MPDITMCNGNGCIMKDDCYRYVATPTPGWQSYFTSPPYDKILGVYSCDYYSPVETTTIQGPTTLPMRKEQ